MRFTRINKRLADENYENITKYERENQINTSIETQLETVFVIAQSFEVTDPADFFSGKNLPIMECYEDLNASYELIKMGFNKQAFVALRVGFDMGLLAAYWKICGDKSKEFRKWLTSSSETPRKSAKFWNVLNSYAPIGEFNKRFPLKQEIDFLGELDDYVHTRGAKYSTIAELQQRIKARSEFAFFEKWYSYLQRTARIAVTLQILVNPILTMVLSDEFLLRKYGTFDKIPLSGTILGDFSSGIREVVGNDEYKLILELFRDNEDINRFQDYLNHLPDLSEEIIEAIILWEQKQHILDISFGEWFKNRTLYDSRVRCLSTNASL